MTGYIQNSNKADIKADIEDSDIDPPALCRDCFAVLPRAVARCPSCRSPRLLSHSELFTLSIAHLDCDAFYAAVEKRDRPELADKPVIIGGEERGVVSTACYQARIFGIHSAMPMFQAKKLCPHAVIVPPNMKLYSQVGQDIRARMRALTPLVEPLSIDEAFMDLSGTERLHGQAPAITLANLSQTIEAEVGISVSIGLSHNKFLAKIASDLDKPRGFSVIGESEAYSRLGDMHVSKLWGVGKAMQTRLQRDGITHIHQIQQISESEMARRYSQTGLRLAYLSRGRDNRSIVPESVAKSISSETTFNKDIRDPAELEKTLWHLSQKTADRCKAKGMAGKTIILKAKTADFKTITRNHTRHDATQMADSIFTDGQHLLNGLLSQYSGEAFRLIGIGVGSLTQERLGDIPDLAEPDRKRRIETERTMDQLREKFGKESIRKGRDFD